MLEQLKTIYIQKNLSHIQFKLEKNVMQFSRKSFNDQEIWRNIINFLNLTFFKYLKAGLIYFKNTTPC